MSNGRRGLILVEGEGDVDALPNLFSRLANELDASVPVVTWKTQRYPHLSEKHLTSVLDRRVRPLIKGGYVDLLVVTGDSDDKTECPAKFGPKVSSWIRSANLSIPASVAIFEQEYEVLCLASLASMRGRTLRSGVELGVIPAGATITRPPHEIRDAKGALGDAAGLISYKPTIHQLAFTRLIDFADPGLAQLACFGTLKNSLRFVLTQSAGVYPPAPALM